MRFGDWLRLDEIQHVSLPNAMRINGIMTDGIDFRFEDWGQGYNPERAKDTLRAAPPNGKAYFTGSFSAPLKDGTFLTVDHGQSSTATSGGLALSLAAQTQVVIEPVATQKVLPKQWFDFAIFYLKNNVVKPPEWPRYNSERGVMATVEM